MVNEAESTISLAELRATLARRGIDLTDGQLKRRRREGLLLVSEQRHRPGLRGSESRYPSWSVDQLELVGRLAQRERRFAQLAVLVRWNGGWVEPGKLRGALIDLVEPLSTKARQLTGLALDDDDRTDQLAKALAEAHGRAATTKLMRRRLGNVREDIERTLHAFAAFATNGQLEWENHNPENADEPFGSIVERALGLDRARTDEIAGNGPLMRGRESTQQIIGELQAAGAFDLLNLGAAFASASDEAIGRAFEAAIACAGVLSEALAAIQVLVGDDVAGFASVTELDAGADPLRAALLVRGLLLMRPLMDDGALESVLQAARTALPQLQAASELSLALPQYTPFLGPHGPERLAELSGEERARVQREIQAHLEARPTPAGSPSGSGLQNDHA
jgi:hypothetical protein